MIFKDVIGSRDMAQFPAPTKKFLFKHKENMEMGIWNQSVSAMQKAFSGVGVIAQ